RAPCGLSRSRSGSLCRSVAASKRARVPHLRPDQRLFWSRLLRRQLSVGEPFLRRQKPSRVRRLGERNGNRPAAAIFRDRPAYSGAAARPFPFLRRNGSGGSEARSAGDSAPLRAKGAAVAAPLSDVLVLADVGRGRDGRLLRMSRGGGAAGASEKSALRSLALFRRSSHPVDPRPPSGGSPLALSRAVLGSHPASVRSVRIADHPHARRSTACSRGCAP